VTQRLHAALAVVKKNMSDADEKFTSRYPALEKPEFQSTIPPHMMAKLTDSERYLVTTVSKQEQQYAWLQEHTIANNQAIIELDVWRQNIDRWKTVITSKWAVAAVVAAMLIPAILTALFEWLFGFLHH